jgi:hypothetical protein
VLAICRPLVQPTGNRDLMDRIQAYPLERFVQDGCNAVPGKTSPRGFVLGSLPGLTDDAGFSPVRFASGPRGASSIGERISGIKNALREPRITVDGCHSHHIPITSQLVQGLSRTVVTWERDVYLGQKTIRRFDSAPSHFSAPVKDSRAFISREMADPIPQALAAGGPYCQLGFCCGSRTSRTSS